jgi:predicted ATPase
VELFLDAARRVKPDYEPDDLEGIARICRLVEGLPLSLLLASSWVNEYTTQEIAEQIERSLDFLSVEWADLPERQRSLRATFEYSWKLLSPGEQQTLMKLAVLRNPFSAQAAWHVAGARQQVLHTLVGKCLLGNTAEGSFQMHDLVRQYSEKELALSQDGQESTTRQKHSEYFLEQVGGWSLLFKGPGQSTALIQADRQIEEARSAWEWAAQRQNMERLRSALEGLLLYYFLRYRFQEGEQACQAALEGVSTAPAGGERLNLEGWLLAWQVHFSRLLGQPEHARMLTLQSLERLSQAEVAG